LQIPLVIDADTIFDVLSPAVLRSDEIVAEVIGLAVAAKADLVVSQRILDVLIGEVVRLSPSRRAAAVIDRGAVHHNGAFAVIGLDYGASLNDKLIGVEVFLDPETGIRNLNEGTGHADEQRRNL
jgi:hypothetical protein